MSYARPKPILKNLLIMVINTAVIYFILQAPVLDVMLKVCACTHGSLLVFLLYLLLAGSECMYADTQQSAGGAFIPHSVWHPCCEP